VESIVLRGELAVVLGGDCSILLGARRGVHGLGLVLLDEALVGLPRSLLASPRAIGVEFTIYDPDRDPEGSVGRAFTAALVEALRP
jgi:arginase family enzyme